MVEVDEVVAHSAIQIMYVMFIHGLDSTSTQLIKLKQRVKMVCNVKRLIVSMSLWILAAANCNEPFQCGSIMYIQYPFWGVSRGKECGHDGFEIICDGGSTPLLNISSLFYRILQIDFATNTLKLSRQDLLTNNACGLHLRNTTMDPNLFTHPPNSTERNLTIYVECAGKNVETLPNTIACDNTTNLFKTGEPSSGPGSGVTCRNNIFVPVNRKDALALKNPTPSSINILRSALDSGFYIQWLNLPDPKRPRRGLQPPVQSPVPPPESRVHGQILDHPRPEARKSPAEKIAIVVAFTVTGAIILSISIYCFLNRRHSANIPTPECKQDVEKFLLQQGSLIPKKYKYSEIKKMTKSLSDKLGQGGYGSVYKGMLPDGTPVAVKVLIETDSNGEEFINEVASISRTSHINIVTLLGFSYEGKRRALVYEFMPNYSLDKFLNQSQSAGSMDCCLNMEKLYKIALGIAKGLQYLHTGCITRIVHFDIKPQNILLDENLCPKISDFGLAKLCKKKQSILSVLGTRGTIGYIAPEVFSRNFGGVSHKSDVYSYGMMLLEIAGARKVDEVEVIQSSENYFPDKIYEQVLIDVTKKLDDLMTEEEEETRIKMILVGFWCIQTIPSSRPSISKVVEMLEGSLQSIQIPPKPFLSTPNLPTLEVSSSLSAYLEIENSS